MKSTSKWRLGLQLVLAGSLCGTTFQAGCLSALGRNFNPCGTILSCDPAEFDVLTLDPLEPDYEFNPTCVMPGLFNCSTPISLGTTPLTGGTAGTGGTGTTTTTTTTGTTTRGGTTGSTRTGGTNTGTGTGFGF